MKLEKKIKCINDINNDGFLFQPALYLTAILDLFYSVLYHSSQFLSFNIHIAGDLKIMLSTILLWRLCLIKILKIKIKSNQLHTVSRIQQDRLRELSVKRQFPTFRRIIEALCVEWRNLMPHFALKPEEEMEI